ncbi:TonB-dependent vitamin B12 receptor [Hahella sp. CCB-MM4]|uniref:TonB-dependent receptor domain-containing protein n=1 Tax=Hahella sp. (strain CCB-MM4) TaxID=1926491 RepID=UPI000BDDA899|nr:TonB-dependent receptor [Hahella sp. CCB-MM4]OZG74981.1 TonB-dependent vitamin B12 receptor [Hahella sp. CCB-MM4]
MSSQSHLVTKLPVGTLPIMFPIALATFSPVLWATTTDPVVVTATRTAQTANESISTVRVLTREEILQRQARSLQDLLKGEAGLHFVNNGGRGQNTSLFMRGTNSDHILVLVDGVKVGSATSGSVPFQDFPIDQIERIEIVRGPRSSLYGSEAIGGVIQIFTRRGGGDLKPTISVTAGSHDTYEASAGLSGGGDHFFYSISVSGVNSGGIDSCQAEAGTEFAGCYVDEPDKDGYENLSGSLRIGYQFENGSEISVSGLRSDNETEFDGSFQNNSETLQEILGVHSTVVLTDTWRVNLTLGRSDDNSDNYLNDSFASTLDTTRDTAGLQTDFILFDRDTLTLGADYQRDKIHTYGDQNFDSIIDDSDQFAETRRENYGGYLQYLMSLDIHDFELSLRHDDNEQFGDQVTGGFGYGLTIADGFRFVASYGTAFKAPTFNQLYYPGFGNPELQPEESETIEFGFRGQYVATQWSVSYFNTLVDELIGYDASFTPANVDEAKITGIEIVVDQRILESWQLGLDLTIQSPRNESNGANEGKQLVRRPERSGRIDLDYLQSGWSAGASIYAAGRSYDDLANTRELGAYQTVDLRAQYEMASSWWLQGRVENLFDTEYETASFYNQPGTSFYLTIRYEPK